MAEGAGGTCERWRWLVKVVDGFLLSHRDVIRGESGTLGVLGNHLLPSSQLVEALDYKNINLYWD